MTVDSLTNAAGAGVLTASGLAMFVYVIDTTIMGVSVADLNTDLGQIQMAITVMGVISLVGYVWAFKLRMVKLGGDPVSEAVRGTARIPRLNLEPEKTAHSPTTIASS